MFAPATSTVRSTPSAFSLWTDDNGADGSNNVGVGLINTNNTCYMNSALQVLFSTVPLITKLKDFSCQIHTTGSESDFCCMESLKELFTLCMSSPDAVQPEKFIKNLNAISPNLQLGRQEDSHEFLLNLLGHIDKTCKVGSDTDTQSLVSEVFGIRSILEDFCFSCCHLSATNDPMFILTLPISSETSLTYALQSYINVEERKGLKCDYCSKFDYRCARTMIEHAPKVMSFQFIRYNNTLEKDCTDMKFPLELDLRPFIHESKNNGQTEYELYAVVDHMGSTASGGHYLCYVRSSTTTWHEKNDRIVRRVTESEVLNRMPYMIFYVKKGTPWFADLDKSEFTFSPQSVLPPASSSVVEKTPQKVYALDDNEIQDFLDSKKHDVHVKEIQDSHDSEIYVFHKETLSTSHVYCDFENCFAHDDSPSTLLELNGLHGNQLKRPNCDSQYPSFSYINDTSACQIRPQATKRQKGDGGHAIGVDYIAHDDSPSTLLELNGLHGNQLKRLNCDSQYPSFS